MLLHTHPSAGVLPTLQAVRNEIAVLKAPPYSRTANTFGHIFAGGYAAGYYSYKWAELLSADAYAAFEEAANAANATKSAENALAPSAMGEIGRKYLHEILEAGGARSAMDNFKAFRGREPQIDALLRHQGMA